MLFPKWTIRQSDLEMDDLVALRLRKPPEKGDLANLVAYPSGSVSLALQLRLFLYIELDSEVDINSLGPWGAQPSIIMEKF